MAFTTQFLVKIVYTFFQTKFLSSGLIFVICDQVNTQTINCDQQLITTLAVELVRDACCFISSFTAVVK